jgi:hypothetical protein
MAHKRAIESVVIFGGAGLVGYQIARRSAVEFKPKRIVLCSLFEDDAKQAAQDLKKEFPEIESVDYEFGNIFVRDEYATKNRNEILNNPQCLKQIHEDVFGDLNDDPNNINQKNLMGQVIRKYEADVVVDCVNTATAISYQDVKSSAQVVRRFSDQLASAKNSETINKAIDQSLGTVDTLLISQAVPQLVRHVVLLQNALLEVGARAYIKVGTTGTGGMGLNIPYTHGEDKPSFTLMAKSSVGFAHTGLLFLLARTPGPIIKEVKPGAMIGYKKVWNKPITKYGSAVELRQSKKCTLEKELNLREAEDEYQAKGRLSMAGIDTGENGFFSRGEFEAITYLNQMEFVTPEEIARIVCAEMEGYNTGKDVIAAIDGAVMDPSYRAGFLRHNTLTKIKELEKETGAPSVAIGELGPPQLSKLLYESHILENIVDSLEDLAGTKWPADKLAEAMEKYVSENSIGETITSLGTPILLKDGRTILRGPTINIPESKVDSIKAINSEEEIDQWAQKGWIDLRVSNMQKWKKRAETMLASQQLFQSGGSADMDLTTYMHKDIQIGAMVGWIFINEFEGARIK